MIAVVTGESLMDIPCVMVGTETIAAGNRVVNGTKSIQPLWTRADVALRYSVTIETVINWEKRGLLTPIHVAGGRVVRYEQSAVEALKR